MSSRLGLQSSRTARRVIKAAISEPNVISDCEKHGHFHLGHHERVHVDGTVLERRILHPQRSAPHAKLFVVRLAPAGQPSFTVELTLHPSHRDYDGIAQPDAGEVRGFLYDPKSGKLEFDLEDDRNNLAVMLSAADAMAAELRKDGDDGY